MGLRDGQTLCIALNILALEIQIDAKIVLYCISSESNCNLNHSSLIMDCRTLINQFSNWRSHYYQEANKCTDALARKGPSIQQDFVVIDSLTVDISMLFILWQYWVVLWEELSLKLIVYSLVFNESCLFTLKKKKKS